MAKGKLKIALVDPVGGHGGMDFYDYGLAQGLAQNEVEVFFFTGNDTRRREYENVETISAFGALWSLKGVRKALRLAKGYLKSFHVAKQKKCTHTHFQFFHLGIQNVLALGLAKMLGFRTIVTIHDVDSFRGKEKKQLQKIGYWMADEIIVHNQLSKRELLKKLELKNVHVIPHGNYKPFVPELPERPFDGILKLLFFGQIKDVKGLEILLVAVKQVLQTTDKIHLTIAGKPWANKKHDYPGLISKLGLTDYVTTKFEYIPNEQVTSFFYNCDVVVLPYKRIYQSGVLLLSMSYGRVVLTSDLPAFKEIIKDGKTGFIFENKNSNDLAETILKLQDRILLETVRKEASDLLNTYFDWKNIGAKTKEIYERT